MMRPALPPLDRRVARLVDPTIGLVEYITPEEEARAAELDRIAILYRSVGAASTMRYLAGVHETELRGKWRTARPETLALLHRQAVRWALARLGDALPALRPALGRQWLLDRGLPDMAECLAERSTP
jgi:hypothetical protein